MSDKVKYKCRYYEEFKKSCYGYSLNGGLCPAITYSLVSLNPMSISACEKGIILVEWTTNLTKKDILDKHYKLLYY